MNDTETRLRDYLHTQAGSVPDTAHGPGLEIDSTGTRTRRRWAPIALAAAGIATVLTLAVPVLNSLADHQPSTAGLPAARPAPVPTGPPLIPYAVTLQNNPDNPLDTWWATIHDGDRTVKNPGVKGNVVARVDGGWLVMTGYPDPKKSQAAVVSPSGQVRPLGPLGADSPIVSPDGRQVAVAIATYGMKTSRVVVVDLEDNRQVASVTVPLSQLELLGWNKDGIWMAPHSPDARPLRVWKPGSDTVRDVGELAGQLVTARGSDVVVTLTNKGGTRYCATAATLGAKGLDVKRDYCFTVQTADGNVVAPYVALSPDGATMALNTRVAVDIATGKTTALNVPANLRWVSQGIFENSDDMIVLAETQKAQKLLRCGVAGGQCKELLSSKRDESIAIAQP